MRPHYWIETETGVKPVSLLEMALTFDSDTRRVALDEENGVSVSTAFLAIDHQFDRDPNAAPILYESLVSSPDGDRQLRRYHTRAEAQEGHAELCRIWLHRKHEPRETEGPN